LAVWFLTAAAAMLVFGLGQPSWAGFLTFAGASLLLAAASASVGGLLGFLFGIPRSLQGEPAKPGALGATPGGGAAAGGQPVAAANPLQSPASPGGATSDAAAAAGGSGGGLGVNTNLEQISDWLTKILVGVGLTNLEQLGTRLWNVAVMAAPVLGGSPQVALFCIVSFSIWGFFAAYLLTRLFLAAAFVAADDLAAKRERLIQHEGEARRLAEQGAHAGAAEQFAAAMQLAQTPEDRRRVAEGAIHNSLYAPPPHGYRQTIQQARAYLQQPGSLPSGRIWAYLAAALGQQYSDVKADGGSDPELARIEQEALAAVRQAVQLDPSTKPLLRALWDPNDPSRAAPDENDLEVFFPRDEFAALLR
jgi:hypothetical protein